jgi:hypothetical protein
MHKNFLWQAFLLVIIAISLWYTISAIYLYDSYAHLKILTTTSSIQWEAEEHAEDRFILKANYIFVYKGKFYHGSTSLEDTAYRNLWAAEKTIKELTNSNLKVWFDPENPNHSSLQKKFPLKESIYAAFLWGLILYFLWLGFYVARFKN